MSKSNFDSSELNNFFKFQNNDFHIKNIQFSSKNNFSFQINNKYKIDDFEIFSDVEIDNMSLSLETPKKLKEIFPQIKKNLNFYDHSIRIEYSKKELLINGDGKILFQNENDQIKYSISKKKIFLNLINL